ncbi:glycosyltransferase [Hymenobacter segetis]|uniref:Glycosyltransferase n=1 Tax=Hymenobacter segetis TaxID=2025509 RepID=A0ABU9LSX3_9BACT
MDHATPARFLAAHEATATAPISSLLRLPAPPRDHCAARLRQQLPPPRAGLRISVIIPAKDEAVTLPTALAALAAQVTECGQALPPDSFEVIVLANNCQDATAAVVRRQAQRFPELVVHVAELCLTGDTAHVGRARRLLMDEACARLEQVGQPLGIIASTDADTQVAPDWLATIQAEIVAGADAVGGRILTSHEEAPVALQRIQAQDAAYHLLCTRLEDLIDPAPMDRWPRHYQHFGASLALTARAYRRVGGLPEVRFLEDEALCQELRRHDLALRHSPRVRVLTSARRQGRVEVGLSWQLSEWLRMSQQQREPHVENPVQLMRRWQLRRQLCACWATHPGAEPDATMTRLGLPVATVLARMQQSATFGVLWEWALVHSPNLTMTLMPLSQALLVLPRLIRSGVAAEWRPVS